MTRLTLPHASGKGPALRRGWTVRHATLAQTIALLPPLIVGIAQRGADLAALAVLAIATALICEAVFAQLRQRAISFHGITTGMIVAVMAPVDAAGWQIVLAVTFGAIIGELVFGGRGFGFLNAGLAALAFLVFSFPLTLADGTPAQAVSVLPGAALLIGVGLVSWRVLASALAGLAVVVLALGSGADIVPLAALIAFPLVFLIADPLGAAATNPGRILYGLLAGLLAGLFLGPDPAATGAQAVIFAALVAAVFAPLADEIGMRAQARAREVTRG